MPPKAKVTKEMVAEASFEVIRENGHENLNARTIAEHLGCSTQPVLYYFKTVDEIREAAYGIAAKFHDSFIMPGEKTKNPMLDMGMNYIRFGFEEKNLFRYLFQSDKFGGMDVTTLMGNPGLSDVLGVIAKEIGCDIEEARDMFLTFFSVAHGLASLLANNSLEYDEKQCEKMLVNVFYGMIAVRKKK
ncbi:MAG: TetR/AcrR family transcriptional regulator [Butyrivibrio sp.]|nr:TetR/AcrR family transcriptional regulator [Butyrivibrio sp.]